MKIHLSKAQWGGATLKGDGKVKPSIRKRRDASDAIRMKKSKKVRITKRIKGIQRP